MRRIAGLNADIYHRWVVTLSAEPQPRNRRSRSRVDIHTRVLAFVYVDFDEGLSLWVDAPLVIDADGREVCDTRRRPASAPASPQIVPWASMDRAHLWPLSPEDCARLALPPCPTALSGFNTPESVADVLADARLDPFRADGFPRDVRCEVVTADGRLLDERLWVRLIAVVDGAWQAALLKAPASPAIRLEVGEVGEVVAVAVSTPNGPRIALEPRVDDQLTQEDTEPLAPWAELEARAIACDERGEVVEAERCWRRAVDQSQRIPLTLSNFAVFLASHGRMDEALPIFLEALEKQRIAVAKEAEAELPDDDHGERWFLGAIELGLAAALIDSGRWVEARELAAPWLADSAHGADAREVWLQTQARERRESHGDPSAIWSCILAMTRGPVRIEIQARHRAGRWEFRRVWAPMWHGGTCAADPPHTDLRAVTPPLAGWTLHLANVLARDVLVDVPAPDGADVSYAAMLTRKTDAFGVAWSEVTALLGARDHAGIPRLLELLDAPVWDRVAFSGPAGRDDAAIAYEAALRRARIGWAEHLPLQDLDLAIGATLTGARDLASEDLRGAAIADLVAALPTLRALQPWAVDFTRPPAEARVQLEAILRGTPTDAAVSSDDRRVALVRDTRRWGISLDGGDPVWLPLGIGGEIGCRAGEPVSADEIPEALVAHAEAARHDVNARAPSAVFADADGELMMAWSMGRWWYQRVRLGAKGRRFKTPKTSVWSTDVGLVMFGKTARRRGPTAPPTFIHPMVAWSLWRAHIEARALDPVEVDAAWHDMLAQARHGHIALRDPD